MVVKVWLKIQKVFIMPQHVTSKNINNPLAVIPEDFVISNFNRQNLPGI
jgi:hypothetical protein